MLFIHSMSGGANDNVPPPATLASSSNQVFPEGGRGGGGGGGGVSGGGGGSVHNLTEDDRRKKKKEKKEGKSDKTENNHNKKSSATPNGSANQTFPRTFSPSPALLLPDPTPGFRDHRSSSDAYVHAVSKSRAAAAAALAKASTSGGGRDPHLLLSGSCGQCHLQHPLLPDSPQLLHPHHQHGHQHDELCQMAHSQGSTGSSSPALGKRKLEGAGWNVCRGSPHITPSGRRSHSQSSLARLSVKPAHAHYLHPHPHSRSTSSLFRYSTSARHKVPDEEEEVTYVWRDGRVQIHQPHAARGKNGVGFGTSSAGSYHYSEHMPSSGQHVQYVWQAGNVQKVIRGSNNEMLSTEVVPPRGPVRGFNVCIVICLIVVLVVALIALLLVLKVFQ